MERLKAIIVKEAWALLRDPRARITLFVPPLVQLLLFSFAATLEVKNADVGFLDLSGGVQSVEILRRLDASNNFDEVRRLRSYEELKSAIDRQEIIAAIVFDQQFDRSVLSSDPATLGVILDGRRINAAQIVSRYISEVASSVGMEATSARTMHQPSIARSWFNPNLDFIWFNIPALACIIVSVSALSITAQSVARERELGTFDQLMVSPLRVHEILIGKIIPPFLVAVLAGMVFVVAAPIYGVPFTGSILLFVLGLSFYALALGGFGMFVSSLSTTQQQAFLGSFVLTVPIVLLSGFAAPIANMPEWLQPLTYIIPARYFLEMSLGIFLKDMPLSDVLGLLWPLVLLAIATLGASAWLFRARME
ncbi:MULTISPECIES: ABC transporter permease [Erythrobacteraceae]|uniref:ABC transporter permease n=1 Tax=Erythrobacteraceae TaxID=335929 RepID=UPI0010F4FAF2|nr:ABC transporter permease [Parerythrobacter lutipelagi]